MKYWSFRSFGAAKRGHKLSTQQKGRASRMRFFQAAFECLCLLIVVFFMKLQARS